MVKQVFKLMLGGASPTSSSSSSFLLFSADEDLRKIFSASARSQMADEAYIRDRKVLPQRLQGKAWEEVGGARTGFGFHVEA